MKSLCGRHIIKNETSAHACGTADGKGRMALKRIVSALISYDKAGQELVQEARERQRAELAHMDEYKHDMYKNHREHLERDLERFRREAAAEQEERLGELNRAHLNQLKKLRSVYLENNERWVAEMVARCIGI